MPETPIGQHIPALVPSAELRPIGQSGILVFPIAWGMWRFCSVETPSARARVEAAVDAGINLFDTADVYGGMMAGGWGSAEALLGSVLTEAPGLRDHMVLATKAGITSRSRYSSSADHLAQALDESLRRMATDYVDLFQIHRRDLLTHPQEVAGALARMLESGKVRAVGVSNHSPPEVESLQAFLSVPLASTQVEFSATRTAPLFDGVIDQAVARKMGVLAWSPLGGGALAASDGPLATLLMNQGSRFGTDAMSAALSWVMVHPAAPIAILGTQTPARIARSLEAFRVEWTRNEWYDVLEAALGKSLP